MPAFQEKAEFEGVYVIRENEARTALLVAVEGKQVWIPQFAIDDDSEVYKYGTSGKLAISQKMAEEKGLV